ncbi:hypothetical protein FKM82_010163 [Ascaphus truei]
MAKLKRDSLVVEQVSAIVKQEEEIMAQETNIVQEYAEQALQKLNEVLPILQQAVIALDSLDKADISEIRYRNAVKKKEVITYYKAVNIEYN